MPKPPVRQSDWLLARRNKTKTSDDSFDGQSEVFCTIKGKAESGLSTGEFKLLS